MLQDISIQLAKRVIVSVLHDNNGNTYKPVCFSRPARPIGGLMQTLNVLNNRGVDEIHLLDIMSRDRKLAPDFSKIKDYVSVLSIPLMVGGNIQTISDVHDILDAGGDGVIVSKNNTPKLIERAANLIGSQSVSYHFVIDDYNYKDDLFNVLELPIGQLIISSRNRDGTLTGYDLEAISYVSSVNKKDIPVVASSGCGTPNHMHQAFNVGASAVSASSMFMFTSTTPRDAAKYLDAQGHCVRLA